MKRLYLIIVALILGSFLSYTASAQPVPANQPSFMVENFGVVDANMGMPNLNHEFTANEAHTYLSGHINLVDNLHYSSFMKSQETHAEGSKKEGFKNFEVVLIISPKNFKTHRYKTPV